MDEDNKWLAIMVIGIFACLSSCAAITDVADSFANCKEHSGIKIEMNQEPHQ